MGLHADLESMNISKGEGLPAMVHFGGPGDPF